MKVVISGSRSVKQLPDEACDRINKIIELGAIILVGDAPGVDVLVQQYLKAAGYQKVTVYHVGQRPRNNVGFQTYTMPNGSRYSDRDEYMCEQADYGLAIWDGVSRGTKANINRLPTRVVKA